MMMREKALEYYRSHRNLPSPAWLAMETGESVEKCQAVIDSFSPKKKPVAAPVQKTLEPVKTLKVPSVFVRIGFLICAFLAIPRTFEFIREWLERSGPHILNPITALVFVIALFLGFQAFIMIQHMVRWAILFFTVLLLLFSVFCTVDGVYSTRKPDLTGQKASTILIDLEAKKDRIDKENKRILGLWEKIDNSDMSFWNKDYQKKQAGKIQDLGDLEERIIKAKDQTVERKEILRGDFEILILLIFSILLDLIGPIALMVALFLPRGK